MKQYEVINAYKTLEILADNEHLSKENQWELYKVRKFLRPHAEFQQEREDILRDKYSEYFDKSGNLMPEKINEFMKEYNEIGNLEIEIPEHTKPSIPMVEGITFKIIEPLEEFIEFTPE